MYVQFILKKFKNNYKKKNYKTRLFLVSLNNLLLLLALYIYNVNFNTKIKNTTHIKHKL